VDWIRSAPLFGATDISPPWGKSSMLYSAYEVQRSLLAGASAFADIGAQMLANPNNPMGYVGGGPAMSAALEVFAHAAAPRGKPEFGIDEVMLDGKPIAVEERIEARRAFGQLKHFVKPGVADPGPKLLIVAPMSGHFATLLRGTVARMVPGHDVYITDWRDAKNVPLSEGKFDLDDYVDYVIAWCEHVGEAGGKDSDQRPHMLAVCQPSVPCFAATACMGRDKHPNRPRTLTLMGGPIDTREAPTAVNTVATERPFSWFEQNVIATVPFQYAGAGRKVYPGFLQLTGFLSMNLGSHLTSHWEMFKHLVEGDDDSADKTKHFYEEYRSVADMTAEFYLQTIEVVFQTHALPKGEYVHNDHVVDASDITDTALLAIEGEHDDISGLGQTKAALTIADRLPAKMKKYYMAKDVGHYGIFNGSKWRTRIAPVLEDWIATHGG